MSDKAYWDIHHFTIANPIGSGDEADVPALLRRVADQLESLGEVEVQDVTLGHEVTADGPWWSATVYFHFKTDG